MGDIAYLQIIAKEAHWKLAIDDEMEEASICLVKVNK